MITVEQLTKRRGARAVVSDVTSGQAQILGARYRDLPNPGRRVVGVSGGRARRGLPERSGASLRALLREGMTRPTPADAGEPQATLIALQPSPVPQRWKRTIVIPDGMVREPRLGPHPSASENCASLRLPGVDPRNRGVVQEYCGGACAHTSAAIAATGPVI